MQSYIKSRLFLTISAFSFISIMRWALVGGGGCNRTKMHLINSLAAELFELGEDATAGGGIAAH